MIFIIFFGLIIAVVIALNMVDSNNINKIQEYLKSQKCDVVSYKDGVYKAACEDKILLIENGFSVDVNNPQKVIYYKEIKKLKKEKKNLVISTNEEIKIEFKEEKKLNEFFNKVKKNYE